MVLTQPWRAALAVTVVLAAGLAWWRVYPPGSLPVPVVGGALLGGVAPLLAERWPVRALRPLATGIGMAVASLAAGVMTALTAASPRSSVGTGVGADVGRALTGGLARILTTTLPAPPAADLLPQLAVLTALAASGSVVLATRREGLVLALPGLALLLLGLVCGVHGAGSPVAVSLPFAVAVGLLTLRGPRPVAVLALTVVVAAGTGAGLMAAGLAARPAADPRRLTAPGLRTAEPTAPLDQLPGWLLSAGAEAFTARVDTAWRAARPPWRLASFDTYDGLQWSASGAAVPVGYDVPEQETDQDQPPEPQPVGDRMVQVHVMPRSLDGVYVPVPGRLTHLARPGMTYDRPGRTLVDPAGLSGSYQEAASVVDLSAAELAVASVAAVRPDDPSVAIPACARGVVADTARRLTAQQQSPIAQAYALQQWLADDGGFTLDPEAEPGHSCARVQRLFDPRADHRGTPEQFATAYVLMARSIGLPSRLVVGFRSGTPIGPDTISVRFTDATAWAEIRLAGAGWVPLDPTPARPGSLPPSAAQAAAAPLADAARRAEQPDPADDEPADGRSGAGPGPRTGDDGTGWLVPVAAVVLAGVALLPVTGVVAGCMRRARRRRRGVLGAWAELLDRLAESGRPSADRTPAELHRIVREYAPEAAGAVHRLALMVDQRVYAPDDEPPPGGTDGSGWSDLRSAERALAASIPFSRRVRHRLDPTRWSWR